MALKKKANNDAMTTEEKEAIQSDEQKAIDEGASTERLTLATKIVSEKFGLDDTYHVTQFKDKGKVVELTLENSEYIVSATIKNSEAHGMIVDN